MKNHLFQAIRLQVTIFEWKIFSPVAVKEILLKMTSTKSSPMYLKWELLMDELALVLRSRSLYQNIFTASISFIAQKYTPVRREGGGRPCVHWKAVFKYIQHIHFKYTNITGNQMTWGNFFDWKNVHSASSQRIDYFYATFLDFCQWKARKFFRT